MNPQEQEQHAGHGHMNVKGVASSSHFPAPVSAVPNKEALEKIRVLLECEAACMNCADRAVEEGMTCWRDCRSCAAVCHALGQLLSLNAPESTDLQRVVASACKSCAEICEEHATKHSSEHCRDCTEACRKCVKLFS